MKILLCAALAAVATGCGYMNVDVPDRIHTTSEITSTNRVIHSIEISAQLEDFIRTSCDAEAKAAGINPEEPLYQAFVDACVARKASEILAGLSNLLEQAQENLPAESETP